MVKGDRQTWKANYFTKVKELLTEYNKCFIVGADNVGSNQLQQIRIALRGTAVVLMGKNTMMRKAIRGQLEQNPSLEKLLPHIKQNVGFVLTNDDLLEVRAKLQSHRKKAPARAGALAPLDVIVPSQNTGLGPEKTSFFQALQITTKISRGTIEIINDVHLIKEGDRVGASEATLLNMLNISPFTYGLQVLTVYDNGSVYDQAVLDITDDELRARFLSTSRTIAAISLAIGYPTLVSVPHSIVNGFKKILAVSISTDYTFPLSEKIKEIIANPDKFAVAAAPTKADVAAPAEKVVESEEEEDDDLGFGLFD